MKVLLFVQTGDARPKCEGVLGPLGAVPWNRCPAALKTALGEYGVSTAQQHAVEAADRWWLVECANAEAGRATIEALRIKMIEVGVQYVDGRILASGGRP